MLGWGGVEETGRCKRWWGSNSPFNQRGQADLKGANVQCHPSHSTEPAQPQLRALQPLGILDVGPFAHG